MDLLYAILRPSVSARFSATGFILAIRAGVESYRSMIFRDEFHLAIRAPAIAACFLIVPALVAADDASRSASESRNGKYKDE